MSLSSFRALAFFPIRHHWTSTCSRQSARRLVWLAGLAVALLSPWPVAAQPLSIDDPVQVNTVVGGDQGHPAVARNPAGGYLVVWESDSSDGGDNDGTSIRGRLYDADFVPLGDDFQVNTTTLGDQARPAVAAVDGEYLVVWQSGEPTMGAIRSIVAQRLDAAAIPIGGELVLRSVSDDATHFPVEVLSPQVAVSLDGIYTLVWEYRETEHLGGGGTVDHTRIEYTHIVPAEGAPGGFAELAAGSCGDGLATCARVSSPAIASLGVATVVWDDERTTDVTSNRVMLQNILPGGGLSGTAKRVSDRNDSMIADPVVAVSQNSMRVTWQSRLPEESSFGIRARNVAASGDPLGVSFPLDTLDNSINPFQPAILTGDHLLVEYTTAWMQTRPGGTDLMIRHLHRGEEAFENDFEYSASSVSKQHPALARGVLVWQSSDSEGSDASGSSIQGRRLPFDPELGLLGNWKADANALDSGPLAKHATLVGGVGFAPGAQGVAFELDGVDDEVVVSHDGDLALDSGYQSLSFWVATQDADGGLVSKQATPTSPGFGIYVEDGDLTVRLTGLEGAGLTLPGPALGSGAFHHVVVTFERHRGRTTFRVFVDRLESPASILALFDSANTEDLRFGFDPAVGHLAGRLDAVRLYDRVLTPGEVEVLFETAGSPLHRDGFESGDTSAWSTMP